MAKKFVTTASATQNLLEQAISLGLAARLITQKRGGFRKHSSLGSTWSPKRVVIIEGISFSIAGARQFMAARS